MRIKKLMISNSSKVTAHSEQYHKVGTYFILEINDKITNLEVCEVEVFPETHFPRMIYTLKDMSYYNEFNKMEDPSLALGKRIRVATEEERTEAIRESCYL